MNIVSANIITEVQIQVDFEVSKNDFESICFLQRELKCGEIIEIICSDFNDGIWIYNIKFVELESFI